MNAAQFVPLSQTLADLIDHDYHIDQLKDAFNNSHDYGEQVEYFLDGLIDKSQKIELAILKNYIPKEKFEDYLEKADYPVLAFYTDSDHYQPVIFYHRKGRPIEATLWHGTETESVSDLEFIRKLLNGLAINKEGEVICATPFSLSPLVSSDDRLMKPVIGPMQRLFRLLGVEKKDIYYVYFYALIISVINLSLPIGIQAIIELISGGVVFNSIVLLIAGVIIAILIAGFLQVMQYTIVEVLQRRVFVKAAFELSYRFPRVRAERILNNYAPELMNRFFDILTIQKGLPKLLIDLTGSALQIIFGLILLSFYHPFFVIFGAVLIIALAGVFYLTGPKGLQSSLNESKYKYKVAHWLEEVARTLFSFKMAGRTSLPLQRMDYFVNNYLYYRKKHFGVLMQQFISIVGFKTIVTGGLLIIGSYLVIDRQITLGQFVATEIVIILVLSAVEKLILSMSNIYDMLTAVEKVGQVTDLELEKKGGVQLPLQSEKGLAVRTKNLKYKYQGSSKFTLNGIDVDIEPGERICISGFNDSGKNSFAKVLTGLLDSYEGLITLDNVNMRDMNLGSLRDNVAKNVSDEDIFDGTLFDNISMGKPNISYQDVMWALEAVGLLDFVGTLPKGLLTELIAGGKHFSHSMAVRIILARCIAEKPRLLVINDHLNEVAKEDKLRILSFLMDKKNPWTLIMISNDPLFLSSSERILFMKGGQIVRKGSYEELIKDDWFRECLFID